MVIDELAAASSRSFVCNDDFRGRIAGIAPPDEDIAIYLLQGLRRQHEQDDRLAALRAEGCEDIDRLVARERFARIVLRARTHMGGDWAEYEDARLVPRPDGRRHGVLSKRKRTHGARVGDRAVLVLREVSRAPTRSVGR